MHIGAPSRVTLLDVAALTGVSKSVASRALLDQPGVKKETALRVKDAAQKLGYTPNPLAQALVGARTKTLGLVLRSPSNPFYGQLGASASWSAAEQGYRVVSVGVNEGDATTYRDALGHLIRLGADGILISSSAIDANTVGAMASHVPTVTVGRGGLDSPTLSSVALASDAGNALVDGLIAAGHQRIALLQAPQHQSPTQHERVRITCDYVAEKGLPYLHLAVEQGELPAAIDALLSRGATALMCPSDGMALDVLGVLASRGLSAPGDVSVTGFDGLGAYAHPYLGLTTYKLPVESMAAEAVRLLLKQIEIPNSAPEHVSKYGAIVRGRTAKLVLPGGE